jgi:hypothetical protein
MPLEPTPLAAAAAHKRERTLERAGRALRELDEQGQPISFQAVARQANVSRQWLYQQPELRAKIERLRAMQFDRAARLPTRDRASESSLRQRVEGLLEENRHLRLQVADLRAELALAYGERCEPTARSTP